MVQITAREVGRTLELTLGEAPGDGEDDDRIRIVVPPVPAKVGATLFAQFNEILFARAPVDPEQVAEQATRIALGAWVDPDDPTVTDEQRAVAEARWQAVQDLRWSEGEIVSQAALYWNVQGGGLDVVKALLDPTEELDASGEPKGGPKAAVRMLLTRAGLWTAYSRLMMLLSSGSASPIPSPAATPDMPTPAGISKSAQPLDAAG